MESDDFTRHYIIRYLSARELVLLNTPPETGRSYPEVLFKALTLLVNIFTNWSIYIEFLVH